MNSKEFRQLAREVINKEKWWDMLSRFIEVLRINIFVVDSRGLVILPPEERRYGGRLLTDKKLKFDLLSDSIDIDKQFEPHGMFFEACNHYNLSSFAIPIKIEGGQTVAYMVIGPVILNKRLSGSDYEAMAEEQRCDKGELLSELGGIRVTSNVMISSILDLLSEIVRDNIELSLKKKELNRIKNVSEGVNTEFTETAKEIYSTVYLDGLLATLLDVALKMTDAECGSIMVQDENQDELTIKVSRGLSTQATQNTKVKFGEGVAGIAARDNTSFIIRGTEGDNRIKKYLKRPDIKEALVMPLSNEKKVFGVLNLHTKKEGGKIKASFNNIKYLSELLSSAL